MVDAVVAGAVEQPHRFLRGGTALHVDDVGAGHERRRALDDVVDLADEIVLGHGVRPRFVQLAAVHHADAHMRLADLDVADLLIDQPLFHGLGDVVLDLALGQIGGRAVRALRLRPAVLRAERHDQARDSARDATERHQPRRFRDSHSSSFRRGRSEDRRLAVRRPATTVRRAGFYGIIRPMQLSFEQLPWLAPLLRAVATVAGAYFVGRLLQPLHRRPSGPLGQRFARPLGRHHRQRAPHLRAAVERARSGCASRWPTGRFRSAGCTWRPRAISVVGLPRSPSRWRASPRASSARMAPAPCRACRSPA